MSTIKKICIVGLSLAILLPLLRCTDPFEGSSFAVIDGVTAGVYIEQREEFSEWDKLLKHTDLFNAYTLNGEMTCFVPHNDAMKSYLVSNGFSKVEDIPLDQAIYLVKYHLIVSNAYPHVSFSFGSIPDTTASGDILISEYRP